MPIPGLTLWQSHEQRWKDCSRCTLCSTRKRTVLARGVVPCDVLFVGEAPGASEDVLGKPFIGPAGKLLDQIISDAGFNIADHDIAPIPYAMTNLTACIPKEGTSKAGEPPAFAIEACAPRLREFYQVCGKPKLVVCVGSHSQQWTPKILEGGDIGTKGNPGTKGKNTGTPRRGMASGGGKPPLRSVGTQEVRNQHSNQIAYCNLLHPAAILRLDISQQGLAYQRQVVTLADALSDLTLRRS